MRKNIITSLMIAASSLFMLSCSDDSSDLATKLSTIQVLSADTNLDAVESTGSVVVNCNPIKAYSNAEDWLTVSVEGNKVSFSAPQNPSIESRNAKLVIKKTETDSVALNVSQQGLVLVVLGDDLELNSDDAKVVTYNLKSSLAPEIAETPDWITPTIENNQLKLSIAENNSGMLRSGFVRIVSGELADTVKVLQYEYAKDIAGDYVLSMYDDDEEETVELNAQLKDGVLTVPDYNWTINVGYDYKTNSFSINSGQMIGKDNNNCLFLNFLDANGNGAYGDASGCITAPLKYSDKDGISAVFSGLAYNIYGTMGRFYMLYISAHTSQTPNKDNRVKNYGYYFASPILYKKNTAKE